MGERKRISRVIVSIVVVLGIVIGFSIAACGTRSTASSKESPQKSQSRIMLGEASLAHVYHSLSEMKKSSTIIVLGTVSAQSVVVGLHGVPDTLSTIQVERVLMNALANPKTILVRQTGGVAPNGTQWVLQDFPLLQISSRYILFLTTGQNPGEFYPVGAPQGVFVVGSNNQVNSLTREGLSVTNAPFNTFLQEVESA